MINPLELRLAALSQQPVPVDTGTGCIVLEPLSTAAFRLLQAGEVPATDFVVGLYASSAVSATPLCPAIPTDNLTVGLLAEWGKLQLQYLQAFKLPDGYKPVPIEALHWHTPVYKYLLTDRETEADIKYKMYKLKIEQYAREIKDNQ